MPDAWAKVLTFDNMRQSVSKTYDRINEETHLIMLFFCAGFSFAMLNFTLASYGILQTTWSSPHVFSYGCLFVGAWFWPWAYSSCKCTFMGMHNKVTVIYLNLICIFIGYILYAIANWVDEPWDKTWFVYIVSIFLWLPIAGLQGLAQVVVADLMPRRKGVLGIKLARCYGAYVLMFGLGAALDIVIFQILIKQTDMEYKQWTHRVESFTAWAIFLYAAIAFQRDGHKHFTGGPQDPNDGYGAGGIHDLGPAINTDHHVSVPTHHGML